MLLLQSTVDGCDSDGADTGYMVCIRVSILFLELALRECVLGRRRQGAGVNRAGIGGWEGNIPQRMSFIKNDLVARADAITNTAAAQPMPALTDGLVHLFINRQR
jgi:hypothetical protein